MKHEPVTSFSGHIGKSEADILDVLILLGPNCDAADLVAITQPMQAANQISGKKLISWSYSAVENRAHKLACGIEIDRVDTLRDVHKDTLIFIAGKDFSGQQNRDVAGWVRKHYRRGNRFVLLGDAVFEVARTGLLNERSVAVHWESINLFRELFSDVTALDQIYSLGGKFSASTCSDATIDIVIKLIRSELSTTVAKQVQQRLNRPILRSPDTPQNIPLAQQYDTRNQTFLSIVKHILENAEEEMAVDSISNEFNISRRQLERLFSDQTGLTPLKFIQDIRLRKAAALLQSTDMSILEIALASGFSSDATLRVVFKRKYKINPSQFMRCKTNNKVAQNV